MRNYRIVIRWSEPDLAFIAQVPALAGCAADGQTRAEASTNAQVVISEWIETAKSLGRTVPKHNRRRFLLP
jgi:predicted RNase H-like HicB family nuclease